MLKRLLLVTSFFILASCNDSQEVKEEFNRESKEMTVTISTVSSESEMKKMSWDYAEGLRGQALYSPNDTKCDIVIYKPTNVDDDETLTLGHELMHCLYGDYHR